MNLDWTHKSCALNVTKSNRYARVWSYTVVKYIRRYFCLPPFHPILMSTAICVEQCLTVAFTVKVILENHSRGDDYECPFARTSIALTKMLCEVLEINGEPRE